MIYKNYYSVPSTRDPREIILLKKRTCNPYMLGVVKPRKNRDNEYVFVPNHGTNITHDIALCIIRIIKAEQKKELTYACNQKSSQEN